MPDDVLEKCKSLYVLQGEIAGPLLADLFAYVEAEREMVRLNVWPNYDRYTVAEVRETK